MAQTLDVLGRDASFTGRLPFWSILFLNLISSSRLFGGYGIGGFWNKDSGPAYDLLFGTWTPNQAHNGFLDIVIHTGIIGFVLFIPFLVVTIRDAVAYAKRNNAESMTMFNIVVGLTILNFSESHFVRMISNLWIVFNVTSFYLRNRMTYVKGQNVSGLNSRIQ
jgi:exopolysaccharide production protein ExoQ